MTESLSSQLPRVISIPNVFGYEASDYYRNPKIGLILNHIKKYGYDVGVIRGPGKSDSFGVTYTESKTVLIYETRIKRYNAWARKYHRHVIHSTAILVHELAHVIESETMTPVLVHKNYWDSFSIHWFTFDMDHDRKFWSIYYDLCKKYHVRDEDRDSYLFILEERK